MSKIDKTNQHIKISGISGDSYMAVIVFFILFWALSGWYRLDCALGVDRACELISMEKDYTKKGE